MYMKKNPKPSASGKGKVTREAGAKPKPHEYTTAEALAFKIRVSKAF